MLKHRKLLWQLPLLVLLVVGTVVILRQHNGSDKPYRYFEGFVFGTVFHVSYQSDQVLDSVITVGLNRVDATLSMFNPQSTLSRVNENKPVEHDAMFAEVVALALQVAADTDGAFDPTVAPLVNLWGFGYKRGQTPTPEAIDSIRRYVGYEKVGLTADGRLRKTDAQVSMDLSAIAKGYGCDVVAGILRQHGVKNFMVEIGGEIVASGQSARRQPWRIGVTKPNDDPDSDEGEVQHILNMTDCAVATSGNYRNFYIRDGKKYAHTIDPATGRPVQHSLLSATVIADRCAKADAYSTAFMVMGIDKAKQVLSRHPELRAYFILSTPQGELTTWQSDGL